MIKLKIPDKCYDCDKSDIKIRKDNHYSNGKRYEGYDITIYPTCREKCKKDNNDDM